MSRTLLNWGIFFIVLGAIALAIQWGYVDAATAGQLLRLWPLILIGIGVGLLLRFTPLAALGGIIVAATAGVLAGALLAGGVSGFSGACSGTQAGGDVRSESGTFVGTRASVDMELSCVNLTLDRQPGNAWSVEARHATGAGPQIAAASDSLELRGGQSGFVFPFGGDARRDWRVTLPQSIALSFGLTLNAASGDVALGGGVLESVGATINASDVRLDMAAPGTTTGRLDLTLNATSGTIALPAAAFDGNIGLNASSLTLCLPPEVGLRIDYDDTLSSDNFDETGLQSSDDTWQDPGYAAAAQRVNLDVSSNVSSITLDRSGDCP